MMFGEYLLLCLMAADISLAFPLVQDRVTCVDGYTGPIPSVRVDTSLRLQSLRDLFVQNKIQAYMIPSEDAHDSEFVSEYDSRRAYISGFSGSAGVAVVTPSKAALWTDGRYFLQAKDELDCNWILMKQGLTEVPSRSEWLQAELTSGQRVGASPYFTSSSAWLRLVEELRISNIELVSIDPDLIDRIWTRDRAAMPANPVLVHPLWFSDRRHSDKVKEAQSTKPSTPYT